MVLPEPIGVAALIIPWNDPVDLAVRKLGAALAAGCTTVVKSSEITPASTAALIETAHATGAFPPGVINLVHGPGNPTGEALVDHPGVDKISFTGRRRRASGSWSGRPSGSPRSRSNAAASSRR